MVKVVLAYLQMVYGSLEKSVIADFKTASENCKLDLIGVMLEFRCLFF